MPGPPLNEPGVFTVKEVHAEFEKLLRDRRHMGLRNLMGDTLFPYTTLFRSDQTQFAGHRSRAAIAVCG